jgi:hypothetical protein
MKIRSTCAQPSRHHDGGCAGELRRRQIETSQKGTPAVSLFFVALAWRRIMKKDYFALTGEDEEG